MKAAGARTFQHVLTSDCHCRSVVVAMECINGNLNQPLKFSHDSPSFVMVDVKICCLSANVRQLQHRGPHF